MSTKSTLDFKALEANRNVVARNYWKSRLDGFEFKSYFGNGEIDDKLNSDKRTISFDASDKVLQSLNNIAASDKAKHIVLLSVMSVFIKKYAAMEDVNILTPVYSGGNAAVDQVFPVRVNNIRGNFREILTNIKDQLIQDFKHGNYPLDKMLQSAGFDQSRLITTAMLVEGVQEARAFATYNPDVLFSFKLGGKLGLDITFNDTAGRKEQMQLLPELYFSLLSALIDNKETDISDIDLISASQKHLILGNFNATVLEYPTQDSIVTLFEKQVQETPESIAVVSDDEQLTYQDLQKRSNAIARHLVDNCNVKAGDLVGLLLQRDQYLLPSILAVLKTGAAYVPIDSTHPIERIQYVVQDSGLKVMITTPPLQEVADQLSGIDMIDITAVDLSQDAVIDASAPPSMAYMIYTSGSTGNPKGVMITHSNVINFVYGVKNRIDFSKGRSMLCLTTVSFDIFVLESILPLLSGLKIVLAKTADQKDANAIAGLVSKEKIDLVQLTPSHLKLILSNSRDKSFFKKIKVLMVGGEAFPLPLLNQLKYYYSDKIYNMYGPTETTVWSTIKDLTITDKVSIGTPIANTTIRIIDENGSLQPIGVAGELCIGGDGVALGYWRKEELTTEKFITDPVTGEGIIYKTGDLAKWLPDGDIYFIGRVDDEVKVRGHRIKLGEIENAIVWHEAVIDAAVITRGEQEDKELIGYYIAEEELKASELRAFVAEKLPEYMVPSYFVPMDNFPLNASGKVDKQNFPEPEINISDEYVAPSTEMEARLVDIWAEILKLEKENISVKASFFELGGHSLRAVTLVNKIKAELGYDISVKAVFDYADIVSLAELLLVSEKHDTGNDMTRAGEKEYYEASVAQKRVYYLHELDPSSLTFNLPMVAKLQGKLDKSRLNDVFDRLMERHETLHTYFEIREEKPVQLIADKNTFELEHYNVSENEVDAVIKNFIRSFDLSKAPLFRAGLIETSPEVHYLAVDMHHIISDGTSLGLLIRDFMALYNDIDLPPLEFSYKDYAEWQHSEAYQRRIAGQKSYWVEKFSEPLVPLDIPVDYADFSQMASAKGDLVAFTLGPEDTRKLRKLVEKETATISMIVMSALKIMLSKLSGQEDVSVGMTVAGRELMELEGMIGMFPIVLPVRTQPKAELTFKEYLDSLKSSFLGALDNQAYPYEDLARELKVERSSGRNPWFDVMYLYQNFERSSLSVPGLDVSQYGEYTIVEHEKLNLTVGESEEQIVFRFTYSTALFKRKTIEKFAEYFRKIILKAASNIQVKLGDLTIIEEAEKDQILTGFNNNTVEYPKEGTVAELFEAQVLHHPDNVAIVSNNREQTYAQLNSRSNRLAHFLNSETGFTKDDLAMIYMPKSDNTIATILAAWKAGGAYVPVDIATPEKRLAHILSDVQPKMIFTDASSFEALNTVFQANDFSFPCFIFDAEENQTAGTEFTYTEELLSDYADDNVKIARSGDDLAYAIYTSGSTGAAKAVSVRQASYLNAAYAWRDEYKLQEIPANILQIANYAFDVFAGDIARALTNGGKLVICPDESRLDFKKLTDLIVDHEISLFESTPALVVPLMEYIFENNINIACLKLLIIGSDICRFKDFKKIAEKLAGKARVINSYGLTEATIDTSYYEDEPANMPDSGTVPIGKPMTNMKFYILDKGLNVQPVGIEGEIYIGGEGVAAGYLNREELTTERFINDPFNPGKLMYKTGDMGKWLEDGNVQIMGRADSQVKLRGFRIEPGEIEHVIAKHEKVREAVVLVKGQEPLKSLVAYYVASEEIDPNDLKSFLLESLPDYMVPSYFVRMEEIPLTPNGKVDRRVLPDPEIDSAINYVEPANATEARLVEIWSEVLQLDPDKVSVELSFFFMGGHSLNAIALVNKVYKEFNVNIALKDFFAKPTIRTMAGYVEDFLWLNKKTDSKKENKSLVTV